MQTNDFMRIAEVVSSTVGEGFFRSLANSLVDVLGSDYAFIAELDDSGSSLTTIALSVGGEIVENVEYAVANTPCQDVVSRGVFAYASAVRAHFSGNEFFDKMGVEAFVGAPLEDSQGNTLGVVTVMYKREIEDVEEIKSTLRIFALRAVAEIERMRVEEKLRQSERRIADLIRRLPSGIQECDAQGTITFMSQTFEKMMGYEPGEGLGKKLWDLMFDDEKTRNLPQYLEYLVAEQPAPISWIAQNTTKDGRVLDVQVDWDYMRDGEGNVTGFASIISDITDRVRVENERKELEAQLRQSEKLNALGTLAGGIAHDFNNILAAILGYSELTLLELPSGTRGHDNVTNIFNAGQRAKEVIARILAFSRKAVERRKPVPINTIVWETEQLLRATLPPNVQLLAELPEKSPCIFADPAQIQQVLVNLCTNAYQSMGEEGGEITVSLGTVQIMKAGAGETSDYVRLVVRDNGSGIDEEIRARVFEPYFTTKGVGEGSGLGLAVVHGIVSAHEGSISVESAPGGGTEFRIFFPSHGGECEATKQIEEFENGSGERVFFVDDEPMLAELAKLSLVSLGYTPEVFTDPAVALERFGNAPLEFDIVVTDLAMPVIAGNELMNRVRAIRSDIPIIVCTGRSDDLNKEGAKLDLTTLLHKPWTRSELSRVLREALEKCS